MRQLEARDATRDMALARGVFFRRGPSLTLAAC